MARIEYGRAWTESDRDKYVAIAEAMIGFMLNNVASPSRVLVGTSGRHSAPGCIIASPSFPSRPPSSTDVTDQDYVFHWVRDAAVAAIELAQWSDVPSGTLGEYASFSRATQRSGASIGFACYRVDATPRDGTDPFELNWSEQSDGPGLRVRSLLHAWTQLDEASRQTARDVMLEDVNYLLTAYRLPTRNLWEESVGYSFFVRSTHLQAFRELLGCEDQGIAASLDRPRIRTAIAELQIDLAEHWDAVAGRYDAILNASDPRGSQV
jgi:glucoamylase